MGWAVALHGGAGAISSDLSPSRKQAAEAALQRCLGLATSALSNSTHSAFQVVELVVRELENDPAFNAGRGSVLTTAGTVEMEACIMDGATCRCGSVSGLSTVVNPISLARLVMEKTPHAYLGFDGAEQFARDQGVETKDPSFFITEDNVRRLEQVKKEKPGKSEGQTPPPVKNEPLHTDGYVGDEVSASIKEGDYDYKGETVGCVAVDSCGNCAAATSTGGFVNKMVGRIGDTPLVGAGNYATSRCAVSATGRGEYIIRAAVAFQVDALMEHKGLSLTDAANEVINNRLENGQGGLVAVSANGDIAMPFNTPGMFRACADEHGYSEIAIWH